MRQATSSATPADAQPIALSCPDCRGHVEPDPLRCETCGRIFERMDGIPLMLPQALLDDAVARQHALYDHIAHEYDDVFHAHVAGHYIEKRCAVIVAAAPLGGSVLDVGCGTGRLGAAIAREGFAVHGVDLSPGMLSHGLKRGLAGAYASVANALPFADDSFDVALTVATLHHLQTKERVRETIREMGRVVKPGGAVVLWDHNPANPYWPVLMRRVPQDTGDERLVPMGEVLAGVQAAGLRPERAFRSGFTPDFLPAWLAPAWWHVERVAEHTPIVKEVAAHNVVVARKR